MKSLVPFFLLIGLMGCASAPKPKCRYSVTQDPRLPACAPWGSMKLKTFGGAHE